MLCDSLDMDISRLPLRSVQSLSRVRLSVTPGTEARQASLSITNSKVPKSWLKASEANQPVPGEPHIHTLLLSCWAEGQPGHPEVHEESEGPGSASAVGETAEGAGGGLQVGAGSTYPRG